MKIQASSVADYLQQIPSERQVAFRQLRRVILDNLPGGYEECLSYGMIGYVVPHRIYPAGYHCAPELPLPFAGIGNQKRFIGFYHSGIYAMPEIHDWFVAAYAKQCPTRLDMGKSCVRFKKPEHIPLRLIGELMQKISVETWIDTYENRRSRGT